MAYASATIKRRIFNVYLDSELVERLKDERYAVINVSAIARNAIEHALNVLDKKEAYRLRELMRLEREYGPYIPT